MLQNLAEEMVFTPASPSLTTAVTVLVDLGLPLQATLKCPFLSHLWHVEFHAGHDDFLVDSTGLDPWPDLPQNLHLSWEGVTGGGAVEILLTPAGLANDCWPFFPLSFPSTNTTVCSSPFRSAAKTSCRMSASANPVMILCLIISSM